MINLDSIMKSRDITVTTKVHIVKAMVFPVVIYGCESWTTEKAKHWRIDTVVVKKTPKTPLDYKEIQLENPKGNQSWMFTGTEAPILWPLDAKSQLTGKNPDAGKDWRQKEKGMTEDKMVGWHHQLNGHESEQAPRDGERQESMESMGSQRVGHNWVTEKQ